MSTPRTPLTRALVLSAALRLVDAEGLDALTMRRLGHELDRDAMTLYRYAPSRDSLLDGVAELVLGELSIPSACEDWHEQLRATARDVRVLALAHPSVVTLLLTRPLATPLGLRPAGMLRPFEQVLALLGSRGFAAQQALHVCELYFGFLCGHLLTEFQQRVAEPEESDALLRLGLHHLPPRDFPRLREAAVGLAGYDGAREMERGLDVLLAGLDSQHLPAPRASS